MMADNKTYREPLPAVFRLRIQQPLKVEEFYGHIDLQRKALAGNHEVFGEMLYRIFGTDRGKCDGYRL